MAVKTNTAHRKMMERRVLVSKLMEQGMDRNAIASQAGVAVSTVTKDIQWVLLNPDSITENGGVRPVDKTVDMYASPATRKKLEGMGSSDNGDSNGEEDTVVNPAPGVADGNDSSNGPDDESTDEFPSVPDDNRMVGTDTVTVAETMGPDAGMSSSSVLIGVAGFDNGGVMSVADAPIVLAKEPPITTHDDENPPVEPNIHSMPQWEVLDNTDTGNDILEQLKSTTRIVMTGHGEEDDRGSESLWSAYKDVWRRVILHHDEDGSSDMDVEDWWFSASEDMPLTEDERRFYELNDYGKWMFMQDKIRDDRVIISLISFIVAAAVILLLSSAFFW